MTETRVLVTGGAGFIGHHLTNALKRRGYWVRAIDIKPPEFGELDADEFVLLDMRRPDDAAAATCGVDHVYALAADMGGMGYISTHHARILHNNSLINLNTVETARSNGATRLPLRLVGVHLPGVPAGGRGRHGARRGARLPRAAAGRLRLGEADLRASLHLLSARISGSRRASCASTISTARRDVGRRTRESAGRALAQDRDREADGRARDRDLGRRRADAIVLLHRRLSSRGSIA